MLLYLCCILYQNIHVQPHCVVLVSEGLSLEEECYCLTLQPQALSFTHYFLPSFSPSMLPHLFFLASLFSNPPSPFYLTWSPPASSLCHFLIHLTHCLSSPPSFSPSLPPSWRPSPCSLSRRCSELRTEAVGRWQRFPFHPTVLLLYFCPDSCSQSGACSSRRHLDLTILPTHRLHPPSLTQWVLKSHRVTQRWIR